MYFLPPVHHPTTSTVVILTPVLPHCARGYLFPQHQQYHLSQVGFSRKQTLRWRLLYRGFMREYPWVQDLWKGRKQDWAEGETEVRCLLNKALMNQPYGDFRRWEDPSELFQIAMRRLRLYTPVLNSHWMWPPRGGVWLWEGGSLQLKVLSVVGQSLLYSWGGFGWPRIATSHPFLLEKD